MKSDLTYPAGSRSYDPTSPQGNLPSLPLGCPTGPLRTPHVPALPDGSPQKILDLILLRRILKRLQYRISKSKTRKQCVHYYQGFAQVLITYRKVEQQYKSPNKKSLTETKPYLRRTTGKNYRKNELNSPKIVRSACLD